MGKVFNRCICFVFCVIGLVSCFLFSNISVAGNDDLVAKVNGEGITRNELADFLIDSFSKEGMEILIRRVLVEQEAKKKNVTVSQKEIDERVGMMVEAEVEKLKSKYGPGREDGFEKDLVKMGYDQNTLRKKLAERVSIDVKPQILAEKLILSSIKVTDQELKVVYDTKYGEKLSVRQVVVKTQPEAEAILRKIKGGADFEQLAKDHSLDRPSAAKGGLMDPLSIHTALGKALIVLKKGEVSDVVPSKNGFHIFRMDGKVEPTETKSFEEALPELQQIVLAINLQKRSGPWFLKLIESADIKNYLKK